MVEAVIVAPLLVLLLVGIAFCGELHRARARAHALALRCALAHAASACEGSPTCEASDDDSAVGDAPDLVAHARAAGSSDFDPFEDLPILGDAFAALFGHTTTAASEALVSAPLDLGTVRLSQRAAFACNERTRSAGEVAEAVLCAFLDCK